MARDLYNRDVSVKRYYEDIMEISDELSFLIIQMETLFFTKKNEVLGHFDVGIDLEELLFSLNANEYTLKQKIIGQLTKYCPLIQKIPVQVDCKFYKTLERGDICVIDIIVDSRKVLGIII